MTKIIQNIENHCFNSSFNIHHSNFIITKLIFKFFAANMILVCCAMWPSAISYVKTYRHTNQVSGHVLLKTWPFVCQNKTAKEDGLEARNEGCFPQKNVPGAQKKIFGAQKRICFVKNDVFFPQIRQRLAGKADTLARNGVLFPRNGVLFPIKGILFPEKCVLLAGKRRKEARSGAKIWLKINQLR